MYVSYEATTWAKLDTIWTQWDKMKTRTNMIFKPKLIYILKNFWRIVGKTFIVVKTMWILWQRLSLCGCCRHILKIHFSSFLLRCNDERAKQMLNMQCKISSWFLDKLGILKSGWRVDWTCKANESSTNSKRHNNES
jgi:hypothetical protein